MALLRYSSAIFRALYAWEDALQAQMFPAHPTSGKPAPIPTIGDDDAVMGDESITINVADIEPSQIAWAQLPNGRDELIGLTCLVRTRTKNVKTARAVMERLEALTSHVELTLFDPDSPPHSRVVTLGFDGEQPEGRVMSVEPRAEADSNGWVGECRIDIGLLARI